MSIGIELLSSEGATLATAMTDLASSDWRSVADPGLLGWSCLPEIALHTLGADGGLVCAAREFTTNTLYRWGAGARRDDEASGRPRSRSMPKRALLPLRRRKPSFS